MEPHHGFGLVPLEVSDEVPSNGNRGRVDFRECLLYPILADVTKPSVPGRLNGIGAVGLGNRDDRNGLAMTTSPRCLVDFFADVP
jgi:hypothetical protein